MNEPEVILGMLGLQMLGRQMPAGLASGDQPPPSHSHHPHRTLAVVGLSDDPNRPSYSVSAYMQDNGYRILPVNPGVAHVLGERAYPTLADLPDRPDVLNVFRLPRYIPGIVDEMIALGFDNLWVQLGIRNEPAAIKAEEAGIRVVMDRCILIEHRRLFARPNRVA